MKSLQDTFEGFFDDADKVLDDFGKKAKLTQDIKTKNGPQLKKDIIDLLNEEGKKRPGKKFTKKDIELAIYEDDGFTMINWKSNEVWTVYEFKHPDYISYGEADDDPTLFGDFNDYHFMGVWKISQELLEFLVELFFD